MRAICTMAIAGILLATTAARGAEATENAGPANTSIVRTVTGEMTFRNVADGRVRGSETFTLTVHPDGSRQIVILKNFLAWNGQQTLMARVDKAFRPIETYAAYWTADGYKGGIYVTVNGADLKAVAMGPNGRTEDVQQVPHGISVVHHGEIANGWYLWSENPATSGEQKAAAYILNAAPKPGGQVSGFLRESTFRRIGTEKVTTPAGTFDAVHYVLSGLDMWVAGEDRLLVRQLDSKAGREYILTRLNTITVP